MKLPIIATILILSAAVFLWPIKADAQVFIGITGTAIDTDFTEHGGSTLSAGIQFNEFISVEGRTLIESSTDDYMGADLEITELYGLYATLAVPVTDAISPYVIAGQTWGKVTASYYGYSASASDSGTSVGIGVRYHLREAWTAHVEFMQLFDDIDTWNIGIQRNF